MFRYFSPKIRNIAEALAENILGIGNDEEGIFVDTLDKLSYLAYLRALYHAQ